MIAADLPEGELHLWRIRLHGPVESVARAAALLSDDERDRMARYRFEPHRRRFALRRGAMRVILAGYLDADPRKLSFRYTDRGKPELAGHGGSLRFNLSDSEDLAILGIADGRRIGVDVERLTEVPEMDDIARNHFSEHELQQYAGAAPASRTRCFYNAWTRKEAWLKARGDGLSAELSGFDVTLAIGRPARLLEVRGERGEAQRWCLYACTPAAGYVAAVAVEGTRLKLVRRRYDPGS
ncbi:MAG: 4'-phosphopantetheinyl transferase family protein [Candidatus Polarisedimenticolia bacterium]